MKFLFVMLLAMLGAGAHAQKVYKWVDENGEVHYSQTLPPERIEKAHERLTDEGLLAERIERVLTAEEQAELDARRASEREAAEQERLQRQRDRLFLATFPKEEDLEDSYASRRENVLAERASIESLLEQARLRFSGWVEQAAELERDGQPVPEHLIERIGESRQSIQELNRRLESIGQRLSDLDSQLAAEIARHRQLTGPG